ncbi:hypothetical protein ABJF43_002501 [Listeria monocytogenes]|uniref:YopX protein domain-containing protein n=1 Tax=Listeria monocytogenes TaxID=1639 RepID=A0A9P1WV81_LISMN|nr:YopX family protein [Listeria monocytogenes]MCZ64174.1 hypothetical protein [Listeria monocytogenes serotype 4b]EAC2291030.1 hypothetical protein [Listeria monocytogenes]EAC2303782.1 hypothetical protein [Listeria monocytogenes]EAC3065841.1 hypothetical protein [Listeria monocytogenes]EAC4061183.1 hypothetical protein [Listeria monocytogenes]
MREIEFRVFNKTQNRYITNNIADLALDLQKGKVLYGDLGHDDSTENITDSVVLEQYIGLKDKNGKKIFKGDIVVNSKGQIGYIAYLIQEAGFVVVLEASDYRLGHRNTNESYAVASHHEVIGNMQDNPELFPGWWE